jgi:ribulose-5-phosphate 4-epimerase/fuculose-1-phosphate aldolase
MSDEAARLSVAQANRILAAHGIVDAFGHVSCRSPSRPDRFWISRNVVPALVTPDDVLRSPRVGIRMHFFLQLRR